MKRLIILILIAVLCFSISGCGGNKQEEPAAAEPQEETTEGTEEQYAEETGDDTEEDIVDEVLSDGEYDVGLKIADGFTLSPIFEKREYKDLLFLEGEFRDLLRESVKNSGLGDFDFHEEESLMDEYEQMKNELSEEELAMYYGDSVQVYGEEKGDEIERSALIQAGITQDFESGSDSFFHYAEFEGDRYFDADDADMDMICSCINKAFGVELDPAKLKAGFEKVLEMSEETKKSAVLYQSAQFDGEEFTESVIAGAETMKEYKGYAVRVFVSRTRTYKGQSK